MSAESDAMIERFRKRAIMLDTNQKKAINKAALLVETYAKQSFQNLKPQHSQPGEYPSNQTSLLRNSISHRVEQNGSQVEGYVGTGVEYAQALEFGDSKILPRPFLRPSVKSKHDEILKIIGQGVIDADQLRETNA